MASKCALFLVAVLCMISSTVVAVTFTVTNKCSYTVWPATLANANMPQLQNTGSELASGKSTDINAPDNWQGRIWARTGCSRNAAGKFVCSTADCGSGRVSCDGKGGVPPATLAEITLAGHSGKDFYDISLVDGFNVPASIAPQGGSGECKSSSCPADVNAKCRPDKLKVIGSGGKVIACKSACTAFGTAEYCCKSDFNDPNKCKASEYSKFFKNLCPQAYSYAYNDQSSTFTCSGASKYVVTFCP